MIESVKQGKTELLQEATDVCNLRTALEQKKEKTSLDVGRLLFEVKKQKAAENVLGQSFYEWVEENLVDTNGRARSGAWAAKMIQSWISVVNFPCLEKFFIDGWLDEGKKMHASWAQVVAAADYVLAVNAEHAALRDILTENGKSKQGECTPVELEQYKDEANDRAGRAAIDLCKLYKSQRIREMIREFSEDKAGIDARVDTEQKFSFKLEGVVVTRFLESCKRLSENEGSGWKVEGIADAIEFCSVFLDDMERVDGSTSESERDADEVA